MFPIALLQAASVLAARLIVQQGVAGVLDAAHLGREQVLRQLVATRIQANGAFEQLLHTVAEAAALGVNAVLQIAQLVSHAQLSVVSGRLHLGAEAVTQERQREADQLAVGQAGVSMARRWLHQNDTVRSGVLAHMALHQTQSGQS
jgi:hypothetical protein